MEYKSNLKRFIFYTTAVFVEGALAYDTLRNGNTIGGVIASGVTGLTLGLLLDEFSSNLVKYMKQ